MMNAVRLAATRTDLDIVRKACLDVMLVPLANPKERERAYPHCRMQSSCNLIVLFQTRAAAEDLREPELVDCTFHMLYLALTWRRSADPLSWFTSNTTHHVSMSQSLWSALVARIHHHRGWQWLGDARVQRGGPAGNGHILALIASARTTGIACGWTSHGGMRDVAPQ